MNEKLRREPFRILFPVGALLAWAAVLPWVLFGTGYIRAWLGTYHALTMTQGFLTAMAFGFLGTMLPRRTGAAPLTTAELCVALGALLAIPILLLADQLLFAELAHITALVTLVQFALRRLRGRGRPPHPSFIFMPLGLLGGVAGASLIAADRPQLLPAGRLLAEEGLMLCLILAVTPMLTAIIAHDRPLGDPSPAAYRRQRALHLVAAALLFASFGVQLLISERAGLLLRGSIVAAELLLFARIATWPSVAGLHRRLYLVALVCVPLGELAAGARPALRVPLLHLTFIGGFSLLVFAVSLHVTFLHGGREDLARRRPWPVVLVGALALLAAAARASAEHFSNHYFEALALASSLWLAGALVWGTFLVRLVVRAPKLGS